LELVTIKSKSIVYLFLIIAIAAWGSLYVVSKYILGLVPTFTVLFFRYLVSAIALLILLRFRRSKPQKIARRDYKYIVLLGFLGYFLSTGAQLLGTKLSNASLASLINSLNPIFIIIFAIPILKEKITLSKVISVIAAIVGVYIIIGGVGKGGAVIGILVSFFSVVTWSLISVMLRHVTQKYDPLTVTTYGMVVAAICALPVSVVELSAMPHAVQALLNPLVVCWLVYIGVVCTALAHLLWNKSLSMIEAGKCALFYPLQPMVSALLGILFLHEIIRLSFIIGAAFILGGVIFSVFANRRAAVQAKL
jgi:Predicted permeases